ncbi:hypothetical protein K461DRAFT_292697 [Myriangium duriaei CBS 260.36]|uniref:Nuclear protein Es2 n=1 Tax=Myriangium duriaei CBS 260.36 TaxID=1168546 RepID=A0A9P4J206_9PEZI|nr:hypothetical protein K461DRAFT_292697 [Myriangium duriaei CBS 260.36]
MAAVASKPLEQLQEWPPLDHGLRPQSEPFDIDELCRRLEAYRLEVKLSQLRERSKALQQTATSNPTYKPRYSLIGEPKGFPDLRADRSSRRQTRLFEVDKALDVDSVMSQSLQEPEWVNPKALLAARSQGMSEDEARQTVQERERKEQERAKAQKALNRRSFAFLDSGAPKASSALDSTAKRRRPLSAAFNNFSVPDFKSWHGHGVRSFTHDTPPVPELPKQDTRAKRLSRLPPVEDRTNWAQTDENEDRVAVLAVQTIATSTRPEDKNDADMERDFQPRSAKRRSAFNSKPQIPGVDRIAMTALPAPAKQHQPSSRPAVVPARPSADSAIAMDNDKKTTTHKAERPDRIVRLKSSIRDLFRRRRD